MTVQFAAEQVSSLRGIRNLRNIDIGLRRAQTVKTYLQQQKFSRAYEGHVLSGGIDDSTYARRVDVFVTASES